MKGFETLIPYIKEKNDDQPIIIIDSREASSAPKIVKGLKEAGAHIKIEYLEKGDYILSDECAVERKTVKDFVYTLTHRYLFDQLFTLKEAYTKPIILIEGYLPIIYKFSRINPAAIWGAIFSLMKGGINLIQTTKYQDTVNFLYVASRQEQIVEKRVPVIHPIKKLDSLERAQLFFMASLPNIGYEKANLILKKYGTPLNALINVDRWSREIKGLGPIITKKCKEVLTTPYVKDEVK